MGWDFEVAQRQKLFAYLSNPVSPQTPGGLLGGLEGLTPPKRYANNLMVGMQHNHENMMYQMITTNGIILSIESNRKQTPSML
eukprot:1453456-Amphidinium_carterae.1